MIRFSSVTKTLLILHLSCFILIDNVFAETESNNNDAYTYSTIEGRKMQLMEWATSEYKESDHMISKAYWVLGDTAVNGCKSEYSNYMVDFKNHSSDNGRSIDVFILPAIVRYLYQFEHCLSNQNIAILRNFVAYGPCCDNIEYLGHGTTNHAILQASSWYLLSQYFNEDTWVRRNRGEYTSQEIQDSIYNNLINRLSRTSKNGHFEIASPTYIEANFFPLLNLIDFAENSTIKSLAEGEAYKTLQYLKNNSFNGKLVPPLTRQLSNELNGSVNSFDSLSYALGLDKRMYWYYFGPELDLTLPDFNNRKSPSLWINYILSDWLPQNLYENKPDNFEEVFVGEIPTFSQWEEDAQSEIFFQKYIGENYALGSSNIRYFPYWYTGNLVEFGVVVDSDHILNQIDCTQPYWYSNNSVDINGKDKERWYDRSSPFMQTHIVDKNNMLFIANIPEKDPFKQFQNSFTNHRSSQVDQLAQFIRCRIPKGFNVINKGELIIQVQEGKTYIQIESLSQPFRYESDDYYQYFILEGGKSAMHFYVTDKVSSMSELSNQASQNSASYTPDNNQILFTAPDQSNQVKMTFNNVLYQDSDSNLAEREIMYESIPLIEEVSQ